MSSTEYIKFYHECSKCSPNNITKDWVEIGHYPEDDSIDIDMSHNYISLDPDQSKQLYLFLKKKYG